MMKSNMLFFLSLTLFLTSCSCNQNPPDLPDVDPAVFQRYSKDNVLSSKILGVGVKYSVYFPASYNTDKDKRYPVVYMLHGIGDDNNSWNGNYLHANDKIDSWTEQGLGEMIYVFPQGYSSYYCNRYDGTFSFMDMFVQEFIPLIDKSFRTIADKEHRAITGYSMGGFGAIALAEKHPEMFIACAPLSMSVRTDWQYKEESQNGWNNQWGKIFGGYGLAGDERITDYYKQHCPLYYFNQENRESLSTVHWYLICGDNEENLLFANDELHCIMLDNGYEHEYRVVDGGHSSSVWMPALNEILPMFDYYMNGGKLWSPAEISGDAPAVAETNADGSYLSDAYKQKGDGTAMFISHNNLPEADLKALMHTLQSSSSSSAYALLPCDISRKSLTEWISEWGAAHPCSKRFVLGIEEGAAAALALPSDTFSRSYYLNPIVGESFNVSENQAIYFAGTDVDANYWDMDKLYCACKRNGAAFEYRIVDGTNSSAYNLNNSLQSIKSYISY